MSVKMTGDFASAMVTVVPVTLLIAVTEISRYYALFAQASVKQMEERRAAIQLAMEQPTQMRRSVLNRWKKGSASEAFRFMYRLYAIIMATVLVPLVFVEIKLVGWLAKENPPASPGLATATIACAIWSFIIVGFLAPSAHYQMEKVLAWWLNSPLEYETEQYMKMVEENLRASGERTYAEIQAEEEEFERWLAVRDPASSPDQAEGRRPEA
ncbi:hypothetical protein [Streptomyces albogriseolus]|uniref:hypothetical protein n=1 Tax=Streptomyces albogriseolus TaxID=1887 RepID=UPI0034600B33